jgi:magnesium transporter
MPRLRSSALLCSNSQHHGDMLSPLKPSAPSASLLRFLRSQSGFASGPAACVRPRPQAPYHEALTSASRRTSSWARHDSCQKHPTLDPTTPYLSDARPKPSATIPSLGPLALTRNGSTTRRPFLRRLFDLKRGKTADPKGHRNQGPATTDEGTDGLFNIGRGLAAKASNELRIRCTEFDKNGNVTLVNGEFRKSELIAKVGGFHS